MLNLNNPYHRYGYKDSIPKSFKVKDFSATFIPKEFSCMFREEKRDWVIPVLEFLGLNISGGTVDSISNSLI